MNNSANPNYGFKDSDGDVAYFHVTRNSSSQLTISWAYASSSGYADYPYPSYYGLKDDDLYFLSNDNIRDVISATSITGYNASINVDNTNHVITIRYNDLDNVVTWSDGKFTYSNYHIQSTANQGYMDDAFDYYPDQPEVAVSLNMDNTGSVSDYVYYYKYYLGTVSNNAFSPDYSCDIVDGQIKNISRYDGYPLNGNGNQLSGGTTTTTDDDGAGEATYEYQSDMSSSKYYDAEMTYKGYSIYYKIMFYKRTHDIDYSDETSIEIPKEVTYNGTTYKVTAIQKWGFAYKQNDMNVRTYCSDYEKDDNATSNNKMTYTDKPGKNEYTNINDHSNNYLESVTFESMSNIHSIGDYAFMSCKKLTSIIIPSSVTYFGQGMFECDTKLTDCRFQTITDDAVTYYNNLETPASTADEATVPMTSDCVGKVRWHTLRNFTFWFCTGMESLELPDGITEIEGTGYGASLQYLTSLINVRLPNTLKTIGSHFLCCAMSLKTLTIPASVETIDGACFHGCENLETVYMLGPASALKTTTGAEGEGTFGENSIFCAGHVSGATFYCVKNWLTDYQNDNGWSLIDEHKEYDTSTSPVKYGNELTYIPIETRDFKAGKWVTAIFPNKVENYKSVFGDKTRVAKMVSATPTSDTDPQTGKEITVYDLTFQLIDGDDIPAATPYMFCPGNDKSYELYTAEQQVSEDFRKEATKEHSYSVEASDGRVITMKGKYVPYTMLPWDFYFSYKGNTDVPAKFYRVADAASAATVGICRCYWSVSHEGVKTNALAAAKQSFFTDDTATGINNVDNVRFKVGAIYDLNGRKLDIPADQLPQGMYIVNGKKVVVK